MHCSVVAFAPEACLLRLYLADSARQANFAVPSPAGGTSRETPMTAQELPLSGVRVIEMTHMVMGPTCGMILAQLGAEVIKVEPPAGDKTRSLGGMGTSFFPL